MHPIKCLAVLSLAAVAASFVHGQDEVTAAECASMLQQLADCYDSVTSYDLLIKYSKQEDGEGYSNSFSKSVRIVLDREEESLASAYIQTESDMVRGRVRNRVSTQLVRNGTRVTTDFLSDPVRLKARKLDEHLGEASIPNSMLVGFDFFPSATYDPKTITKKRDIVIGAIATHGATNSHGRKVSVEAKVPIRQVETGMSYSIWSFSFDLASSLPTNYSCSYQVDSEGTSSKSPRYRSVIEWCEPASGILLPESMLIVEHGFALKDPQKRVREQLVEVKSVTEVEFKWFSVNEKIDASMWDEKKWLDYEVAHELCEKPLADKL